jgi:regulator of protease activity HflC (stomatin/prohibitin superfamily)
MEYAIAALVVVAVVVAVMIVAKYGLRRTTVYEYERGIQYVRGKFQAVIPPGQYWYVPWSTSVRKVDVRPRFASITGQEILSADGVTLRVSLAANYEVVDPDLAINKVQDFQETLYAELQLALRQIIGSLDIDALMTAREDISRKLAEMTAGKARELGLRLISVGVKDIMFPGKLKDIFAQVVGARKEGLAALEKARGETAALRNLANAAQMVESNPGLMQLRMLQTLGGSSGNTLVLGLPAPTAAPLIRPRAGQNKDVPPEPPGERASRKSKRR